MYEYETDKQKIKELRSACETIIKNVQQSQLKEYFTFQFLLIGSGSTNLITKNGQTGEFDLDYNLILQRDKKGLINNPKQIKQLFIKAFNDTNPKLGFKPAENSTSVITSKLIFNNQLCFSFDVAILCEGNNGNYFKIVNNKKTDQYYWNEVKDSRGYQSKIATIKKNGQWNSVRNRYLELKNLYLSRQEDISSFSILIQTINEINQSGKL